MRVLAGMLDTVALFSALDVSVGKKKTCNLHDFARNRMTPCVANFHGNHYTSTYFILSRQSDVLIFLNSLSLRAGILEKKRVRVTAALRVSTCIIHIQLAESRPEDQCLVSINNDLSHLGGYIYSRAQFTGSKIYSIGLVKAVSESLQELVSASSS